MDERGGPDPPRARVEVDAPLRRARRPAAVLENGGPRHGPPTPPTLGAPRQSRGAPRYSNSSPKKWGAPTWPPNPPNPRSTPAKPWRSSILQQLSQEMGSPDMAPQPPQPSEHPGEAVALLDTPTGS